MIKDFRHKGLRQFCEDGSTRGMVPQHARRIKARLDVMADSDNLSDLNVPGYDLHELQGDRAGTWSIYINGPWCITFRSESDGAGLIWADVDYEQYH